MSELPLRLTKASFMTANPAFRNAPTGVLHWALPALLILLVQVTLYLWMAPRGLDFTDESYYFHNFLHWREFTGTITFFGAYFEWPFRAMGKSIAGIRILSLVVILAVSAVLMHALLRFSMRIEALSGGPHESAHAPLWCYLAGPMAAAMFYFSFLTTLRAPSYNLLSFATIAIATACMLRTLENQDAERPSPWPPLLYGVALGACFLSKATTSLMMVVAHVLFFIAVNRVWRTKRLLAMTALIVTGFAVNLVVLTLQFPGWLNSMREGMEIMRTRGGYGMGLLIKAVSWDLQRQLMRSGPLLVVACLGFVLLRRTIGRHSQRSVSLLTLLLVTAAALAITLDHRGGVWLPALALVALGLWSLEVPSKHTRVDLSLMVLLFALPLVFSFGTNMPILSHSAIASLFAFCAVFLRLYRLYHLKSLSLTALAASICMLCVPSLATQVLAVTNVDYTYRQYDAMSKQVVPVTVGTSALLLDRQTEQGLRQLRAMAAGAGLQRSQAMLDFANNPGLLYAVGAVPLGSPWLSAGFEGSEKGAERVIQKVDAAALRGAWLLTTDYKKFSIDGWQTMMARRLGPGSHTLAGSVTLINPSPRDGRTLKTVTLQLWKPATPAISSGVN